MADWRYRKKDVEVSAVLHVTIERTVLLSLGRVAADESFTALRWFLRQGWGKI